MQPKIVTTITCVKCGGTMTGSESEFTITCPYCATEYTVSIAATVAEPVDIVERIRLLLACVLDGNPRERQEALLELEKNRDPRVISPIVETMKTLNDRMTKSHSYDELNPAYFALNKIIQYIGIPGAAEPLIELLGDEDGIFRQLAALALKDVGNPDAIEPLLKAAADPEVCVRDGAVTAIGAYQDPRIPGVLTAALDDVSPRVVEAALRSLGKIKYAGAVGRIIEIFHTRSDRYQDHTSWGEVRKAAVWALGDIGTEDAVLALVDSAGDDDPMIREAVAQELKSLRYRVNDEKLKAKIGKIVGDE